MTTKLSPFQLWARIKSKVDLLLTVHSRYPKLTGSAKRIISKAQLTATVKKVKKAQAAIAKAHKSIETETAKLAKELAPRAKEIQDSESILKMIAKADFPDVHAKVWGRKK